MAGNWEVAPPPTVVDGRLAVPIDISAIAASIVFDAGSASAAADATLTYTVGPTGGNPFFDLRQVISEAWLDGVPLPVSRLAHHAFGAGAFTDLRIVSSPQDAGTEHTLRVRYPLATPDSELGGGYLPRLEWAPGGRLTFALGMSDLWRARYLEAWLPANLPFDQYAIQLDIRLAGTAVPHAVITNGAVTTVAPNHWTVAFPARFSSLSPLLEIRAADTVQRATGTATLPVSGTPVTIEAWRPDGSTVDLATQIDAVRGFLVANEHDYGGYLHGHRFVVAFFQPTGGMEYEGGTTTSPEAAGHEVFHSWFARGVKPAGQADGWWDEGYTRFHDAGATAAVPLDYTDPPVTLCSRDPWQRHTPSTAYAAGSALFRGVAALLGAGALNSHLRSLYAAHAGTLPVSTQRLEEHLVAHGGDVRIVDAFHRFVYGLPDPAPAPDLWLLDAAGGGSQLWVRTDDDGGTEHQDPRSGQDNWFHARVRNRSAAGRAAHFVVIFRVVALAGTEVAYPGDFLPATAATAAFDLAPGQVSVVKARWPRVAVPPAGSRTSIVAAVLSRHASPPAGSHLGEVGSLARLDLTVADRAAGRMS